MELVKGDELGELLKKRQTPFAPEDILKWADQLLDALDYLHTLSPPIVHRDIKPQNIKLTARGKIKLLDFGIAKGEDVQIDTITDQTFIAATLHYSPIEQMLRVLDVSVRAIIAYQHNEKIARIEKQNADPKSDIYALGATLYHLLTNELPIDALKRALEVWAEKPDPLIEPKQLNSKISSEMSAWLLKAVAVDSENRFVSAGEMRQSLRRIFAESLAYEIKEGKDEENKTSGNYSIPKYLNLKTELLPAKQEKSPDESEEFSARKATEEITSVLPFSSQPSMNADIVEKNQTLAAEQNLLSKTPSVGTKVHLSENSSLVRQPSVSSQKKSRLFLIVTVAALFLLILGATTWRTLILSNESEQAPANLNTNTNKIVTDPTPLINNGNAGLSPISTPIDNMADTIKKTDSRKKQPPKKTTDPAADPKRLPTRKQSDADCIFNDNCR